MHICELVIGIVIKFDSEISGYKEKEKGQINFSTDLSFVAPAGVELLNLWNDFRKVVKFIDENPWVKSLLEKIIEIRR